MRASVQSVLVVAALAAAVGTGTYEMQRVHRLRARMAALAEIQAAFPENIRRLERECARAAQQNTDLEEANRLLNRDPSEVLKLRAELTRLRADFEELGRLKMLKPEQDDQNDLTPRTPTAWLARANTLKTWIAVHPEQQIPEFQYLREENWLDVVKGSNLRGEYAPRTAAFMLRARAKEAFGDKLSVALRNFVSEHDGDLPTDLRELNPYLSPPMTDDLISAYKLFYSGKNADVPKDKWPIAEIRPLEEPGGAHLVIGTKMYNRSLE